MSRGRTTERSVSRRPRARRWIAVGILIAAVGLLITGAVGGHFLFPRSTVAGQVEVISPPPVAASSTPSTIMPDLAGLNVEVAGQALRTAGIDAKVTVTKVPRAGAPSVVVAQAPAADTKNPTTITLTVARPMAMPKLAGAALTDATATLQQAGASVLVKYVVKPEFKKGTVIESVPAEGSAVPSVVTLRVSDPGEGLPLTSVAYVQDDCDSDTATLDGTSFDNSIACDPSSDEPSVAEWAIGRHAALLTFTAGADDSGAVAGGKMRVFGDGKLLDTIAVKFGTTSKASIDVHGVLRLRIEASTTASDDTPTIVLGSPLLLATRSDLARIPTS